MKIDFYFLVILPCILSFTGVYSQDASGTENKNELKGAIGIASSRNFTGISWMAGYNRYFGKNYVGLQYNHLKEVSWFGSEDGQSADLSITMNRELLSGTVKIAIGAGVASVMHKTGGGPDWNTFHQFGVPLELNITTGNHWISGGGNFHYNFNRFNPFLNFNLMARVRLF